MLLPWLLAAQTPAPDPQTQDATSLDETEAHARDSISPLPRRARLKFEPGYTWLDTGYETELLVRATVPFEGIIFPGFGPSGVKSIFRADQTLKHFQDNGDGTSGSGLTKLLVADLVVATLSSELAVGVGVVSQLPTMTSTDVDGAQWTLGPGALVIWEPVHELRFFTLAESFWTIAKDRGAPSAAYMTFQPVVTWHFLPASYVFSDAIMTFDYTDQGGTTVPLDLGLGQAFSECFDAEAKGYYTVAGKDVNAVSARAAFTFRLACK